MGTKNNPAVFDCYTNAEPNEPMFILLARDKSAPALVEQWCVERIKKNDPADNEQIKEAFECVDAMREWRRKNRP